MSGHIRVVVFLCACLAAGAVAAQDSYDSDGDGLDDNEDNCTLVANAPPPGLPQRDTDGDYRGNMCDADFNNDNQINFTDLAIMKLHFFSANPDTDLDGDGSTNFTDLNLLVGQFFGRPGPTATDPATPPCNCYWSRDCGSGDSCDWGVLTKEDNCVWRDVKPDSVVGAGCSIESNRDSGEWVAGICDGVCKANVLGSTIGGEDSELMAQTLSLWGAAMLKPSMRGGGPIDSVLASAALDMPFDSASAPLILGRHATDMLALAAGDSFYDYFCHWEGHPDEAGPVVDLSRDSCRARAGQLTIEAFAAELRAPGSAAAIMQRIPQYCAGWQLLFASACDIGPGALACAIEIIEGQAHFLRTPGVEPPSTDPLRMLQGAMAR